MSEHASSDSCLSQSTDVVVTDIEENVPSAGQGMTGSVSSELPPIFQLQPMFPSLGSTMTGPACSFRSSSASLRVAGTGCLSKVQSSRTHIYVADSRPRRRFWTSARCRGLRPHHRLSSTSTSPARASFGLLRVSPGRHHKMRACVYTCPRSGWNVSQSLYAGTDTRQLFCMKTKGGLLSAETCEPTVRSEPSHFFLFSND